MRFYRSLNQAEVKPEEAGSRTGELIIASGLFRKPIYCSTRCQRVAKRGEAPSVKCRATPAVRGAGTRPTAGLAAASWGKLLGDSTVSAMLDHRFAQGYGVGDLLRVYPDDIFLGDGRREVQEIIANDSGL
jgi:hypothetical protein